MSEFLNPKSMSTPGAAGALIMFLTNAICFNFPLVTPQYVALILSFVVGSVVFSVHTLKTWERGAYWVVNSLIIFAMGTGAANIGAKVSGNSIAGNFSVIGEAYAQEVPPVIEPAPANMPSVPDAVQPQPALALDLERMQALLVHLQQENEMLRSQAVLSASVEPAPSAGSATTQALPQEKVFFKKW